MRNFFVNLAILLSVASGFVTPAMAQTAMSEPTYSGVIAPDVMPYPQPSTALTFIGQDQYYTVTFRGNGEAVVTLKVIFSNLTPDPISSVTLRSPKPDIQDVLAFQVQREPQCIRYDDAPLPTIQPLRGQGVGTTGMESMQKYTPRCAEYQAPDYYQYWYGVTKYQKSTVEIKGDSIIIGLPTPVQPDNSASFMLYYRTSAFTSKNLYGAYSYTFETLKAEDKVRTLQVGISTDSDLVLKDAQGSVNYIKTDISTMESGVSRAMANSQLDSAYQQIGSGSIVKNASNLQPLESYKVKGAYAPSTYALYGPQLTLVAIVMLLGLAVAVYIVRRIVLHYRNPSVTSKVPKSLSDKQVESPHHGRTVLEVLISSFVASILVAGYTVVVMVGVTQFNMYYYSEMSFVFMVFVTIISFAVYSIFMFGPAIFFGIRKGYLWGLGSFVTTTVFLMIYLVVLAGFVFLMRMNRGGYYPSGPIYNKAAPSKT